METAAARAIHFGEQGGPALPERHLQEYNPNTRVWDHEQPETVT
jgi:hypothetical protein